MAGLDRINFEQAMVLPSAPPRITQLLSDLGSIHVCLHDNIMGVCDFLGNRKPRGVIFQGVAIYCHTGAIGRPKPFCLGLGAHLTPLELEPQESWALAQAGVPEAERFTFHGQRPNETQACAAHGVDLAATMVGGIAVFCRVCLLGPPTSTEILFILGQFWRPPKS